MRIGNAGDRRIVFPAAALFSVAAAQSGSCRHRALPRLIKHSSQAKPHETSNAIVIVLVLAAIVAGAVLLPVRQWFMEFESYVKSLGAIGPVAVVLVYVLCTVLFIPGSAITIGAGTLFGLKTGFVVAVLGANLGALCAFLLARAFCARKSPAGPQRIRNSALWIRRSGARVSKWCCSRA